MARADPDARLPAGEARRAIPLDMAGPFTGSTHPSWRCRPRRFRPQTARPGRRTGFRSRRGRQAGRCRPRLRAATHRHGRAGRQRLRARPRCFPATCPAASPKSAASGPAVTMGPMPGITRATAASTWPPSSPSRAAGRESSRSTPGEASICAASAPSSSWLRATTEIWSRSMPRACAERAPAAAAAALR